MTRADLVVSVKDAVVYVDGFQATGKYATDEEAWQKVHSLLRRYGTSLRILVKPTKTQRAEVRFWRITPPDIEPFAIEAKSVKDAKELARVRLGRKKLPKGTLVEEEV